jgi:hypothetical protein
MYFLTTVAAIYGVTSSWDDLGDAEVSSVFSVLKSRRNPSGMLERYVDWALEIVLEGLCFLLFISAV